MSSALWQDFWQFVDMRSSQDKCSLKWIPRSLVRLISPRREWIVQGSEHETSGWRTGRLSWSWWSLVLGESQTRPGAEGIEHTVEIFSFLREVIRAAAVIIVLSSVWLLIRRGLYILAFFPNRWKIGFPNMRLFIISVIGPAIISATIHKFYRNLSTMKASF